MMMMLLLSNPRSPILILTPRFSTGFAGSHNVVFEVIITFIVVVFVRILRFILVSIIIVIVVLVTIFVVVLLFFEVVVVFIGILLLSLVLWGDFLSATTSKLIRARRCHFLCTFQ